MTGIVPLVARQMPQKRADQGDDRNRTGGPDQQDGKAESAQPKEGETDTMRLLLMVHRRASDDCEAEPIVIDTDDPLMVEFPVLASLDAEVFPRA